MLRSAPFADLSPGELYEILRLRSEVFVVEQECVFLDLDDRDREESAIHLWLDDGGEVVGYARVLREGRGTSVGRVVTAPTRRNVGLGAQVMNAALDVAARPVAINSQSQLVGWYARFGFVTSAAEFIEDGIPHTPMVLE